MLVAFHEKNSSAFKFAKKILINLLNEGNMFEYTIRATMDRSEPRSQQYKFLRPSFSVNEYTIAVFAQILIKLHHDEFSC